MLKIVPKSVNETKQEKILELLNTLLNTYISNIKVYFYNTFHLAGDVAELGHSPNEQEVLGSTHSTS